MKKLNNKNCTLLNKILYSIELYNKHKITYINLFYNIDEYIVNMDVNESLEISELITNIIDFNSYIDILIGLKEDEIDKNLSYDESKNIDKNNQTIVCLIRNFIKDAINADILINTNGLIIKSKNYENYCIYIDQDLNTKNYTIYLWKKDINENGLEFNIKTKEELQTFFDNNNILVQWEEKND